MCDLILILIPGKKRVNRVVYSASTWMKTFLPGSQSISYCFGVTLLLLTLITFRYVRVNGWINKKKKNFQVVTIQKIEED
jgi:hypothetical protein